MTRRRAQIPPPATLGELAATGFTRGLLVRCARCEREVTFPIRALIARHGADAIAYDIAQRQSCGQCREPGRTWWVHRPVDGAPSAMR